VASTLSVPKQAFRRYRSCRPRDIELRAQLRDLANERKRFGYRRLFVLLRVSKARSLGSTAFTGSTEALVVRKRRARRRAVGARAPILAEARPNARWLLDFVRDQFACGRRIRILNIVDDASRECLAAIPHTSISRRSAAERGGPIEFARIALCGRSIGMWSACSIPISLVDARFGRRSVFGADVDPEPSNRPVGQTEVTGRLTGSKRC
jgi:transposase InsO family protein